MAEQINELGAIYGLMQQGFTPEQARARVEEARAMQFAQLSPSQQRTMLGMQAASGVGRSLGSLFGVQQEDPLLNKATQLRELENQFDTSTSTGLADYAKAVKRIAPDLGLKLEQKVLDMRQKEAVLGKTTAETAKAMSEGLTTEQRNAAARADAEGNEKGFARGSAEWAVAYNKALRSLTTKEGAVSDIGKLFLELQGLDPVKDADRIKATRAKIEKLVSKEGVSFGAEAERISRELYNKPYSELTQTQMAAVNKRVDETKKNQLTVNLPGVKQAGDVTGLRKDVQAITKPYQDQLDAAQDAIDLVDLALKSNNFAAVSSLSRSLAKASGEAQLTGKDVDAFGIDPSLIGRISDTATRLALGRPTEDTLKKLKQLASALKAKAENKLNLEEDQLRETARVSKLFTEDQINTVFRRRPSGPVKTEFRSVAEAEAAKLPKGTIITINGRRAVVE